MRTATEVYQKPADFLRSMTFDMYDRAHGDKDKPRTLTGWLEEQEGLRSSEYPDDGLDAFERLLAAADIRVGSVEHEGVYSDICAKFLDSDRNKVLFPEFCARKFREVSRTRVSENTRSSYSFSDDTPGSLARPYADNLMARTDLEIAPAIPLSELIAETTPIVGGEYRSYYITNDAAQQRKVRVGESAPLPKAKLNAAEHTVPIYKFGRSLEASYEAIRRMRIDRLGRHLQKMAVQTEIDQVAAALDVIVNGDGNTGTAAAVHNLTTLDTGASAGTLTLKGWLAFKFKFANPYMVTTTLMQEVVALQLALLNSGSANIPLMFLNLGGMVQSLRNINRTSDGVGYGWTTDAPALKIVGFDNRFELERVVEVGSEIAEVMRWINRQTEELTMSMNEGYAVIDPSAALILDVNA
ncbi:MAG: hypothetical protein L0229_22540 [Blastocatellia bacterium]|nr:hypothetical protein [Blastocatellia bacterium]